MQLPTVLRRAASLLLDVLAPRCCISCSASAIHPGSFCGPCSLELFRPTSSCARLEGTPLIAPFAYRAPLDGALHAFKYAGRADLAAPLSELVVPHLRDLAARCDAFVPVPLHPLRLAERGYNQSALLARRYAAACGRPLLARALVRLRSSDAQVGRSRQARFENARSAFAARDPAQIGGLRVALVDDVVTTGATALACRAALRTVGADVCAIVAVARTFHPVNAS